MHIKESKKFTSESEAQEFVKQVRLSYESPISEVYVSGPFFIEIAKVFAGMEWAMEGKNDYWSVSYEVYK